MNLPSMEGGVELVKLKQCMSMNKATYPVIPTISVEVLVKIGRCESHTKICHFPTMTYK